VDITVYLPDEIGERAKAEGLKLSRMLRDAVEQELNRRSAMTSTLKDAGTHEVGLMDADGSYYTGRITGSIVYDDHERTVFLTTDKRVIVWAGMTNQYWVVEDPEEELQGSPGYADVMHSLGIQPIVDL